MTGGRGLNSLKKKILKDFLCLALPYLRGRRKGDRHSSLLVEGWTATVTLSSMAWSMPQTQHLEGRKN